MFTKNTLLLLIRLLQECLEEDYTAEELRSKIRDMLRVLGVHQVDTISEEPKYHAI